MLSRSAVDSPGLSGVNHLFEAALIATWFAALPAAATEKRLVVLGMVPGASDSQVVNSAVEVMYWMNLIAASLSPLLALWATPMSEPPRKTGAGPLTPGCGNTDQSLAHWNTA